MKNKIYKLIQIVLISLLLLSSGFLFYSIILFRNLETFYLVMAAVIIIYIGILLSYLLNKYFRKNKFKKFFVLCIISFIFSVCFSVGGYYIYNVYSKLQNLNKNLISYSSSLVTLDSKYKDISNINDSKIGVVNDIENIELYTIPYEIIEEYQLKKNNTLIEYNSTIDLVKALYDKEVDMVFINSNFADLFVSFEEYSDIAKRTKVIYTKSKEIEKAKEDTTSSTKMLTEPFTILLLGIDSATDGLKENAAFNGDTIMLVTFNPKTLNATMFSIPRDTYVKIACGNRQIQKINTSAYGGSSCVINTVENLTGIEIDYYAKINFKGVVSLVDALGGIEVNVPYSFCEQNSSRQWGKNTVFVYEGKQTLNGEQALALSRNRHYPEDSSSMKANCPDLNKGTRNDFIRGKNQQLTIEGLLNKVKSIRNANTLMDILDIVSKNIDTNLSTDQILSFYDVIKNIISAKSVDVVNIQKTFLRGYDMLVWEPSVKGKRYAFFNWNGSLNDIVEAMEINLGIKKHDLAKNFSFSSNEAYEKEVIGNKNYNETKIKTVPEFKKYTYSQIKSWASSNKITVKILDSETKEELSSLENYTFVSQSMPATTLLIRITSPIELYYKPNIVVIPDPVVEESPIIEEPPIVEEPSSSTGE